MLVPQKNYKHLAPFRGLIIWTIRVVVTMW